MEKLIDPSTGVEVQADADAAAKMLKNGFVREAAKTASAPKQSVPKKESKK